MERKTTQRIIGSLVAIALVVILLPLLLSKNEASTPTTVKAPPFPDQTADANGQSAPLSADITPEIASKVNQTTEPPSEIAGVFEAAAKSPEAVPTQDKPVKEVAAATPTPMSAPVSQEATQSAMTIASAVTTTTSPKATSETKPSPVAEKPAMAMADATEKAKPVANDTSAASSATNQEDDSDDMIAPAKPVKSIKPAKPFQPTKSIHLSPTKVVSAKAISKTSKNKSKTKPLAKTKTKATAKTTKKTAQKGKNTKSKHPTKTALNASTHNKLDLKKSAWVIQMGSFKDKNNARHLADKLRASGYKAFMHDVKSSHNNSTQTRVYIGPEGKQASALKLSNQVANKMDLHGVVVLYKPLEL